MSKRNMVVTIICIVVALASFFGGILYKYEDYEPIVEVVEYSTSKHKFRLDFQMPLDIETANVFLDWAALYHQAHIDAEVFTDLTLEEHLRYIYLYNTLKILVLKFEEFEEGQGASE